jgi:hypothetical protein
MGETEPFSVVAISVREWRDQDGRKSAAAGESPENAFLITARPVERHAHRINFFTNSSRCLPQADHGWDTVC